MAAIFRRPELARQMARQLLRPGVLDEALRSGLFLSGIRRTGKTTFLKQDLIPALEGAGALVIYVDLWSDTKTNPASLVQTAIIKALSGLQDPASGVLQTLKRVKSLDLGGAGFKFGFQFDSIGSPNGPTLAEALTAVVDQAKTDVVLILDEVQQALTTEDGSKMLFALKAARDAINPRPDTQGHFLFVGTGSHRAMVAEMTARRAQPFAGAASVAYPVLGADYVEHLLKRLANEGTTAVPSIDVAVKAFETLGNRPEEMLKALRQLHGNLPPDANPDQFFSVIAATIRSSAADIELAKVDDLGNLATAIFERIASSDGDARGIFSAEAAAQYSAAIGREVLPEQVQPVANELLAANIIMRKAHGVYCVADPYVQEVWREKAALSRDLAAPAKDVPAPNSGN